jgi:hypothetical protein
VSAYSFNGEHADRIKNDRINLFMY